MQNFKISPPREPLLDDEELSTSVSDERDEELKLRLFNKVKDVRDFYEDMITSGDLRLTRYVRISGPRITVGTCSRCEAMLQFQFAFFHGCGCKIMRP